MTLISVHTDTGATSYVNPQYVVAIQEVERDGNFHTYIALLNGGYVIAKSPIQQVLQQLTCRVISEVL